MQWLLLPSDEVDLNLVRSDFQVERGGSWVQVGLMVDLILILMVGGGGW